MLFSDLWLRFANMLALPAFCIKSIQIGDAGQTKTLSTFCRNIKIKIQ